MEHLLLNPEDQSLDLSTHVRYLTNACNTSSKGPDGPLLICMDISKYMHTHKNKVINLQKRRIMKL